MLNDVQHAEQADPTPRWTEPSPMTRIISARTLDVRAPTSITLAGSDAVHQDPDYSGAYVFLATDGPHEGVGMTFTIGRGNDLCCAAIELLAPLLVGCDLDELVADGAGFWRRLTNDGQLRWLGPEKGVIHLATAALVNAVWDLWAKVEDKPLWRLVSDLTPEQFVDCVDFRYLTDVLDRDGALDLLRALEPTKGARIAELERDGYPAYITSAGWLGYDEAKVRALCRDALADGWRCFKTKVGIDVVSDMRRCEVMREEIGDLPLMADANQVWDVGQAIEWMGHLAPFDLRWIEEPTSPDDVLGHAAIRRAVAPVGVATGEHAANRVVFKQLLQAEAIDYCQIDACRLGGVNEVLAVLLLAAKFGVPVCPHAGGLGLCEYVQHLSAIDHICVSGSLDDRTTEFADHLHEHFVHPAVIERGRYVLPTAPGYSIDMHEASYAALAFPNGDAWRR
jgi:L-fuconate dehydratase